MCDENYSSVIPSLLWPATVQDVDGRTGGKESSVICITSSMLTKYMLPLIDNIFNDRVSMRWPNGLIKWVEDG